MRYSGFSKYRRLAPRHEVLCHDWSDRILGDVGVFVCLFVKALSERRIIHILNAVVAAATAACVLVAVIIYGVHYSDPDWISLVSDSALYWSFGLCVTALVLDVISTTLLVLHLILTKP
uniref:Uncharacterized protein LOC111119103 isoform X2 n=1 Tax=Crassostrea virginica TaxID=6565 RepID=A0A8B8CFU0_CRAVI|nr:uncharacterized protein LOC111119103 isoform X2 [Crassostrea virginica]